MCRVKASARLGVPLLTVPDPGDEMRRLTTATSTLLTLLLVAAMTVGCNRGPDVEDDPRGALREALSNLGDYAGYEVTLRFAADDTARAALLAEGDFEPEVLDLLLGAAVQQRYLPGEDPDDLSDDQTYIAVEVDGQLVLEVVALPDYETYLRVDLPEILRLVDEHSDQGMDPSDLAELEATARQFGLADEYDVLQAGGWFRLTGLEQISNFMAGMAGAAQPDQEDLEEFQAEVLDSLRRHFEDLDITYVGSEDAGERVRVTADAEVIRNLVRDLLPSFVGFSGLDQLGEDPQALTEEILADIPDSATVSVDVWLDDGEIRQVAFDVLGALRQAGEDVPAGEFLLVAQVREFSGSIDAPADAHRVDLFGIIGGFLGGAFGAFEGGWADDMWEQEGWEEDAWDGDGAGFDDLFADECIDEAELDLYFGDMDEDTREQAIAEFEAFTGRERC